MKNIIIIGGGSSGLSTAYELSKLIDKNEYQIIILEKSYCGAAQTGQCCGFIRNYYNVREMAFSASESYKRIKKMSEYSEDLALVRKGLLVFDNIKNKESMLENIAMLQSLGIEVEYLEGEKIKNLFPGINHHNSCIAYDKNASYLNPLHLVKYLVKKVKEKGVIIRENTTVLDIKESKSGFSIATSTGEIKGAKVVNTTAASTNQINAMLGFNLPVKAIKINNSLYRVPIEVNQTGLAIADFENLFYMIPHREFVDVSTIALDLKKEVQALSNGQFEFDHVFIEEYQEQLLRRLPHFKSAVSLGGFGSCIDITPDYYPIIGRINNIPNYYCAAGFSGTGYKHFPIIGQLLAELILEINPSYPELVNFFAESRLQQNILGRKGVSDSYFVKD